MPLAFVREIGSGVFWLFRVYRDASDKISITVGGVWYVFPSWGENGSFRVICVENNG